MRLLVGLTATSLAPFVKRINGLPNRCTTGKFHREMVPSVPPDASTLPSELKARLLTPPLWMPNAVPVDLPLDRSHPIVLLGGSAARVRPSGLKATLVTSFGPTSTGARSR